jgi:hypothetical protein
MLRDPRLDWDEGIFPYDALREAGITPDSSMKEIHNASFDLIEKGMWNLERRLAWDAVRKIDRRLWVDFLLYPITPEEIVEKLEVLLAPAAAVSAPDVSTLLAPDFSELERMHEDFGPLQWKELILERTPDFDLPASAILNTVEFDG